MVLDSLDRPHIVYGTLYQQIGGNYEREVMVMRKNTRYDDSTGTRGRWERRAGYILSLLLASILSNTALSAQPPDTLWTRTYGGTATDWGSSVQETSDGGFIIAATTGSFGPSEDVYLIKTDGDGDTLWTKRYGGAAEEWGISVQETFDGGFILLGKTDSFGAGGSDFFLVRMDAKGDTLWTRTYGGNANDIGRSVRQTTDGGYIIVGETYSFGAGDRDIYLVKTDEKGDTLWTRTYGGSQGEGGNSVIQTTDGGYIIAGWTASFGAGSGDVYLIKTDPSGHVTWERSYGATDNDVGYSVQETSDKGYIVAGWSYSFSFASDFYLIKTDANGDTLWTRIYGENDGANNEARSVQQASDGGYIVVGYTNEGGFFFDVYLLKVDSEGNTLWQETLGGKGNDLGYSVQQTSDGGYIVAGYSDSFGAGGEDVYVIRLKPEGTTGIGEVSEAGEGRPTGDVRLDPCYPNPFNPSTSIRYTLPRSDFIDLSIYTPRGQRVRIIDSGWKSRGTHIAHWDGRDARGKTTGSGVYLYRLKTSSGSKKVGKMLLLK